MLNERDAKILKAVVESHIHTHEPVGASSLSNSPEFDISPATIRSVMASLERSGFLVQPHTSAGRVPADKGYRYYAQRLTKRKDIPVLQLIEITNAAGSQEWLELGELMAPISSALSRVSSQAGLMGFISSGAAPIKRAQFVGIDDRLIMAIMITDNNEARRYVVRTKNVFSAETLEKMTNYFNARFSHLTLPQIRRLLYREMSAEQANVAELKAKAMELAEAMYKQANSENCDLRIEGEQNLIGRVNGKADLIKLKSLFGALAEKRNMYSLLADCLKTEGVSLLIGSESGMDELLDYTVVTHAFSRDDGLAGAVGIIGPKQMDYSHIMAVVACAAQVVSHNLSGSAASGHETS